MSGEKKNSYHFHVGGLQDLIASARISPRRRNPEEYRALIKESSYSLNIKSLFFPKKNLDLLEQGPHGIVGYG